MAGDNGKMIDQKQIRSSKKFWDDLQALARHRNTDLTGYINAVVFHEHLTKPENARILEELNQQKS